jgi:hypothetical protein
MATVSDMDVTINVQNHLHRCTVFLVLEGNGGDLTNHDVAVISDWAHTQQRSVANQDWKRAFALIREGCDLLLRRRARSAVSPEFIARREDEPEQLNHSAYLVNGYIAMVHSKYPAARAVYSEQQGWLIVADDSTLNIGAGPRCETVFDAWVQASVNIATGVQA